MATRVRVRAAALGLSTVLGLSAALSTVSTAWSPVARAGYHDAPSGGAMGGHGSTGAAPSAPATTATVEVTLSEFRIEPARLQVPANVPIVLRLRNTGQVPHNLEVEAAGKEYELAANLSPGGTADLTLPALPPGEYPLYCPVGNHAALGMKGVLVVSAAPAGPMGGGSAPRARFHVGQRQVLLDGRTVPLDVPVHIFQGGDAWV
ncbi:MAG: cupredoxin domain-containing protein, partial [Clostridia bacterium]|nr:cupredoxin domain-containing protein [Clostridia bacterium]